jgi:hypothetical protein
MRRLLVIVLAVLAAAAGSRPADAATPAVIHVARQWGGGVHSDGMITIYPNDYLSATSGYRVFYFDHAGCVVLAGVPLASWVVDPTLSRAVLDMPTPCGRLRAVFRGYGDYYPYPVLGADPSGSGAGLFLARLARAAVSVDGVERGTGSELVLSQDLAAVLAL